MTAQRVIRIDTGLHIEVHADDSNEGYRLVDEISSVRFYPGELPLLIAALTSLHASAQGDAA